MNPLVLPVMAAATVALVAQRVADTIPAFPGRAEYIARAARCTPGPP